jgi:hypothetical protein
MAFQEQDSTYSSMAEEERKEVLPPDYLSRERRDLSFVAMLMQIMLVMKSL